MEHGGAVVVSRGLFPQEMTCLLWCYYILLCFLFVSTGRRNISKRLTLLVYLIYKFDSWKVLKKTAATLWRKDRLCEQRRKKKTEESWKKVCHHRSHSECQWCVTWVKFRGRENIVRRNKNLTGPIHLCILKCVRVFQQQLWQLYSLPFWFSAIRLTSQP